MSLSSWSFEGHLNSVSRMQKPDNNLVLANGVDIFDPLTERLYKGYIGYNDHKESYVIGSQQGSTENVVSHTTTTPDYFHVHNIILPMSFGMNSSKHNAKGQPLIVLGKDFFEIGIFITGITISKDPINIELTMYYSLIQNKQFRVHKNAR